MTARLLCVAPNPSVDRLLEIDRLVRGTIHRPTLVRAVAGGKGLNVARAAVALGATVTAVGIVAGHNGRWLAEAAASDGIVGRFVWTDGETRVCTSIADAETGELTEVYEAGPAATDQAWAAFEDEIAEVIASGGIDAMTISGSLPPGAPRDGHARLVALASAAGLPVAIDGVASGSIGHATWAGVLRARPWLVKANREEASGFTRDIADPDRSFEAARAMVDGGAANAIVTLGPSGAIAVLDGTAWSVGPPADLGRFPVGSGDAFLAGSVVGLVEGLGPDRALALGTGAGAANALVAGAGVLDATLARTLASAVVVTRVE